MRPPTASTGVSATSCRRISSIASARRCSVKLDGSAAEMLAALPKLPVPSLIHFSDYVHGGFDKQYPDHLPPRPAFGTPAELRALFDLRARARPHGHALHESDLVVRPPALADLYEGRRGPARSRARRQALPRALRRQRRLDHHPLAPRRPGRQPGRCRSSSPAIIPSTSSSRTSAVPARGDTTRTPPSRRPLPTPKGSSRRSTRTRGQAALDRGRLRSRAQRRGATVRVHVSARAGSEPRVGSTVQVTLPAGELGALPGCAGAGPRQGRDAPPRPGPVRHGPPVARMDARARVRDERPLPGPRGWGLRGPSSGCAGSTGCRSRSVAATWGSPSARSSTSRGRTRTTTVSIRARVRPGPARRKPRPGGPAGPRPHAAGLGIPRLRRG